MLTDDKNIATGKEKTEGQDDFGFD